MNNHKQNWSVISKKRLGIAAFEFPVHAAKAIG